jgi:hypothetical protein
VSQSARVVHGPGFERRHRFDVKRQEIQLAVPVA